MDERRINIDEFFRRQMDTRPETPPPAVWDALEKRLDDRGRKKAFPIWWFWTIAGLLFISASVMIAGYMNKGQEVLPMAMQTTTAPPAMVSTPIVTSKANTDALVKNNVPNNTNSSKESAYTQNDKTAQKNIDKSGTTNSNNNTTAKTAQSNATTQSAVNGVKNKVRNQSRMSVAGGIQSNPDKKDRAENKTTEDKVAAESNNNNATNNDKPIVTPPSITDLLASLNIPAAMLAPATEIEADEETYAASSQDITLADEQSFTDTSKKTFRNNADTSQSELDKTMLLEKPAKVRKPLPISAGLRVGYIKGFNNSWRADKFMFAPYFEYGLPQGFSLMVQPSVQVGKAKTGAFANGSHSYYEITKSTFDSTAKVVRGKVDSSILTPNPPDTIFRTYAYGQSYDSIHVGYKVTENQVTDIELPLMVKYKINKTFSVILGVSGTYTTAIQTKEEVQRFSGMSKSYTENIDPATFYVTTQGQLPPDGPARKANSDLFSYSLDPFSAYQPRPNTMTSVSNFFRYGFMVGASVNLTQRWMLDVLIHKTGVNTNSVPDKQLQKIYTQPYVRVLFGYRFTK